MTGDLTDLPRRNKGKSSGKSQVHTIKRSRVEWCVLVFRVDPGILGLISWSRVMYRSRVPN